MSQPVTANAETSDHVDMTGKKELLMLDPRRNLYGAPCALVAPKSLENEVEESEPEIDASNSSIAANRLPSFDTAVDAL